MGGSVKLDGSEHEDDALSLALRAVRLERATFTQAVVARGCSIRHAGGVDEDASLVCYQVLEGACALDAGRGEARPLRAGTLVLVAARMTHEVRLLEGATSSCRLVRGVFGFEGVAGARLLHGLPAILALDLDDRLETLHAVASLVLAGHEAGPGHDAVKRRLAEAFLMQAVGSLVERDPALRRRLLPAADGVVHRCLALMERRPDAPWTLQSLAREAHTSRSVLAERFMRLVGEPPIAYLTRLRLDVAAGLLVQTAWPLARVAESAGYQSEAAFCRAFRRQFATPPAAWRRSRAGSMPRLAGEKAVPHQLDAREQHARIQQPVEQPRLDAVRQAHAHEHA